MSKVVRNTLIYAPNNGKIDINWALKQITTDDTLQERFNDSTCTFIFVLPTFSLFIIHLKYTTCTNH